MTGCPRFARWPRLPRRDGTRAAAIALSAALFVALFASGCGTSTNADATGSGTTAAATARPKTNATLQIVSPAPNERTGADVQVIMQLAGAHLAPATQTGGAVRPDAGHIHLSLDGQLIAMPLRLADRLPLLHPGSHTVQAEFVASDHVPFANRVVAAVTFDVR